MTPDESGQETQDMPVVEDQVRQSPQDAHEASETAGDPLPLVGAAFAGGFLLAKILKRLGGDD